MASAKISYNNVKNNIDNSQLSQAFSNSVTAIRSPITMRCIDDIRLDPKGQFNKLFPLDDTDIENIRKSMEERGFDKSKALDLAIIQEEPETQDNPILIEGHQRLIAAQKADIEQVPTYIHTYETRKDALIAAVLYQLNRRNLTSGDKVKAFELLDKLKNPGRKTGDNDEPLGKSVEGLSEQLGISTRTGEKIRDVLQNGDEETKEALKNDEISINKAWQMTNAAKKGNTDENDEINDTSDANNTSEIDEPNKINKSSEYNSHLLDTGKPRGNSNNNSYSSNDDSNSESGFSEGTPAGLNFNHSDGIERPVKPRDDSDPTDIIIRDKNLQIENAKKEYYAKGFKDALKFAIGNFLNGRTSLEITQDERVKDLSTDSLEHFELTAEEEDAVKDLII